MKLKTHKTTIKRLSKTGTGKIRHSSMSLQHLRHNKTKRQKAAAKTTRVLAKGMAKRLQKLVPYL